MAQIFTVVLMNNETKASEGLLEHLLVEGLEFSCGYDIDVLVKEV